MQPSDILAAARDTLQRESASITSLMGQLDEHFVEIAYVLLNCTGHVLVAGSGTSNPVGARLAHLLTCCGTPALFIHPGDGQHGLSGAVTDRDVLILISKGGETTEVNHLARIARERGATLVAFTEKPASTLGKLCPHVLRIQAAPDVDPFGLIATGSSLTFCAMADALCVTLLNLRGYSRESFGQTHPGGAVGLQLAAEQNENNAEIGS